MESFAKRVSRYWRSSIATGQVHSVPRLAYPPGGPWSADPCSLITTSSLGFYFLFFYFFVETLGRPCRVVGTVPCSPAFLSDSSSLLVLKAKQHLELPTSYILVVECYTLTLSPFAGISDHPVAL